MNQPLVTVAMPFHNCRETLADAIRSMLWQSYGNWELLLCDDGSVDGSLDIARSFQDARVCVWSDGIRKRLPARLNECVERARGEYFARMDGDDISYPVRLERQVGFLEEHEDVELVGASMLVFRTGGIVVGERATPVTHHQICAHPASGFAMAHPTFCGRTKWFRRNQYKVEADVTQDQELLLRTHQQSRFANIDALLLAYREDRLSLAKTLRARLQWIHCLRWNHGNAVTTRALLIGTVLTLARASVEMIAIGSGSPYKLLRHRATPAAEHNIAVWCNIHHTLQVGAQAGLQPSPSESRSGISC